MVGRNPGVSGASAQESGKIKQESAMAEAQLDEAKLKELLKSALAEVLEERHELMRDLIEETLEDLALKRAIAESEQTPEVSRAAADEVPGESPARVSRRQPRTCLSPYLAAVSALFNP
jgi:hypothetical protein